jgi:hypothetical protein
MAIDDAAVRDAGAVEALDPSALLGVRRGTGHVVDDARARLAVDQARSSRPAHRHAARSRRRRGGPPPSVARAAKPWRLATRRTPAQPRTPAARGRRGSWGAPRSTTSSATMTTSRSSWVDSRPSIPVWCQQCIPLIGSGWTGKVMFWCTPASFHHTRSLLGSVERQGLTPWIRRKVAASPFSCMSTSAVDQRSPASCSRRRQRPM